MTYALEAYTRGFGQAWQNLALKRKDNRLQDAVGRPVG